MFIAEHGIYALHLSINPFHSSSTKYIQIPSLHCSLPEHPMMLIVINRVLRRNVLVPPMSASTACAAAQCMPVEGSTHFIPPKSSHWRRYCIAVSFRGTSSILVVGCWVLVLVASMLMSIGGAGDGRNLFGDGDIAAAVQLTAMMTDANQFQHLNNFTSKKQISSNFLDKKVNAKKSI